MLATFNSVCISSRIMEVFILKTNKKQIQTVTLRRVTHPCVVEDSDNKTQKVEK